MKIERMTRGGGGEFDECMNNEKAQTEGGAEDEGRLWRILLSSCNYLVRSLGLSLSLYIYILS